MYEAVRSQGSALVHAQVADWLPHHTEGPELRSLLGSDHARLRRMTHPPVRGRFIASRLLLKHLAGAVLAVAPQSVELAYSPAGRPYLRGLDQVNISLSHTDSLMVVGLTRRGLIGVDAELTHRQMLAFGSAERMCTPHELQQLARIPESDRNAALVRLWTLKEAYSKAIGQGTRFPFTEFGFGTVGGRIRVRRPDGSPGTGGEWAFQSRPLADRYTVGVALFDEGLDEDPDVTVAAMRARG
ncbi:4'-phosphopantetheinyl transferase family protein [Streptomyces scopuliridis]|uniref:4'-phosphopantetheinyl transferase family protein n=1 Tax=Streptomyces scopuliridis TaxID=452529 RepID=UPI0036AC4B2E